MLHTSTEGKKTSVRGTLESNVVCTVAFRNSRVLLCRKKPPEKTELSTTRNQKASRNVDREQETVTTGAGQRRFLLCEKREPWNRNILTCTIWSPCAAQCSRTALCNSWTNIRTRWCIYFVWCRILSRWGDSWQSPGSLEHRYSWARLLYCYS